MASKIVLAEQKAGSAVPAGATPVKLDHEALIKQALAPLEKELRDEFNRQFTDVNSEFKKNLAPITADFNNRFSAIKPALEQTTKEIRDEVQQMISAMLAENKKERQELKAEVQRLSTENNRLTAENTKIRETIATVIADAQRLKSIAFSNKIHTDVLIIGSQIRPGAPFREQVTAIKQAGVDIFDTKHIVENCDADLTALHEMFDQTVTPAIPSPTPSLTVGKQQPTPF